MFSLWPRSNMHKDDLTRLKHMLDAAKEVISFVSGKSREDLDSDRKLVLSVVKDIEIIGEAASKVSSELKNQYKDIPWLDITGMRHHLIHAYFDVDLNVVWTTVTKDIPFLIPHLERILSEKEK